MLLYSPKVPSDEEAHSTVRPPANADEEKKPHPDIAGAILRAKSNASVARSGPPSATAKINKFDLAQALALTTSEGEAAPSSSRPPREDDAPFVAGEVEVVGEEEVVNSGVPSADSLAPASKPSRKPAEVQISVKPATALPPLPPLVVESVPAEEERAIVPKRRSGNLALAIIAALVGLIVIGYVYVRTR